MTDLPRYADLLPTLWSIPLNASDATDAALDAALANLLNAEEVAL